MELTSKKCSRCGTEKSLSAFSLVKDLGECLEFYGEPERLGIPARDLARYLVNALAGLTDALRALPLVEPASGSHAEAGAVEQPESAGAQEDLFPSVGDGSR